MSSRSRFLRHVANTFGFTQHRPSIAMVHHNALFCLFSRKCLTVLFLFLFVSPSSAKEFFLTYHLFLGGIHANEFALTADIVNDRYKLTSHSKTVGLFDFMIGFTSKAVTEGIVENREFRPLKHRADNYWLGAYRKVRINYSDWQYPLVTAIPTAAKDGRDSVPPKLVGMTIDPLSAALDITTTILPAGLERELKVFDGRRRYNLQINSIGIENVNTPAYHGPATRIDITLERIAGFSSKPWLPRTEDPETVSVWFASILNNSPLIPVQLKAIAIIAPIRIDLKSAVVNEH